jgi:uncharacterized membrane protein YcaP (DUF421 family)
MAHTKYRKNALIAIVAMRFVDMAASGFADASDDVVSYIVPKTTHGELMWILDNTLLEIALRAAIIYVVVLVGIRLIGKREIAQMTPVDLVLLLLIANAVQNAMTGPDTSVTGGFVAAAVLLGMNVFFAKLLWRYPKLRQILEGTPRLLIRHGVVLKENLVKEKISMDDLQQALREHGVADLTDVSIAMLEVDGSVSVLREDEMPTQARPHHRIRLVRRKNY